MDALFGPASSSLTGGRGRTGSSSSSGLRAPDAAFATPVGQLVERATSEALISPDWGLNMEACDLVNAAPECAQDAARALQARLQSPNPKVLMLTLALLEALIKNGSGDVHAQLGERDYLQAVGALTEGKQGWDVKEAALKLLQECGLAFESQKDRLAFHPYYMELLLQGKQFPPLQPSSPVFSPPPAPSASAASASASASASVSAATQCDSVAAGLAKLEQDLRAVDEGIKRLLGLLPAATKPIEEDEAMAEAVGFLESCQPRLEEVIEAGMEGALNEALLERALVLHDELVKALDKERAKSEARAAQGSGQGGGGATDDLIDFGEDSTPPAPPAEAVKPVAVDAAAGAAQAAAPSSSPLQPPTTTSTATDSAVLAEADRLLQGLGLEEKQQEQQEEGEGKGATA